MLDLNKKRLIMLAKYLEKMSEKELIPATIAIGNKLEDGSCQEMIFPDYGQWLPLGDIFPDGTWTKNHNGMYVLKENPTVPTSFCIMYYLGAQDLWIYMHLFVPYFQNIELYGGKVLRHDTVFPKNVASNIRELIKRL